MPYTKVYHKTVKQNSLDDLKDLTLSNSKKMGHFSLWFLFFFCCGLRKQASRFFISLDWGKTLGNIKCFHIWTTLRKYKERRES